ncbi:RagB/SusD family nutrient uptake outer membrane protein [Labilibacter sediminis]|nr:RagB/SusD family nutrient uptake outer membrane protein [Labilibacter sediminis]
MKQYIKLLFAIVFAAFLGGCDYLDYDESSYMLKEDVFEEFSRTKRGLTQIYSQLPHDYSTIGGAMRSSGTDEALHVNSLSAVTFFNDGSWSPLQTVDTKWGSMYSGIYNANLFLEQIKGKMWEELKWNDDYKDIMAQFEMYPYEARFLRAYFHFELMRRYGSIPIVTKELTVSEANNVDRSSFEDVVKFIVSECDTVAKYLPVTYEGLGGVSETGRVTKGAAMALKARVQLYAASPLHNTTGDITKWADAAEAAYEIINSSSYVLEAEYKDVVNNGISDELILGVRQNESAYFEIANFPIGYEGGNTGTCPTQNLVNAYEMASTGLAIDDPASGYNPVFPYSGRDPRLNETVIVNGSTWKGKTVEVWYGGPNGAPKANATKTGYYLKKYVIESVNLIPLTPKRHNWVLFRYAEVLLNYAEAMNEAYGGPEAAGPHGMTALQAVNLVRLRAGMPEFPAGMSQDDFRAKLRNERRVELAFEDHRFWDVRRWETGPETDIKGVTVVLNPFGGYVYNESDVETRVWDSKMNLYPIPQVERFKNPKLGQNPGWE